MAAAQLRLARSTPLHLRRPSLWPTCTPRHLHARPRAATDAAAVAATASPPHISVLLDEVLRFLQPMSLKVYVDCTLGAGGHAAELMQAHQEMNVLVGIDQDPSALAIAKTRLEQTAAAAAARPAIHLVRGNFCDVKRLLHSVEGQGDLVGRVDGMLMDLGVSSMQIDSAERGFSFSRDGPIDMRMDPDARMSAEEVVNTWSEAELGRIIRDYGEDKMWRTVARRIVQAREQRPITTTQQLADAVGHTILARRKGAPGGKGINPATRTFQALRIAVNDELQRLEQALPQAVDCLAPGGRLAVISFHSLEDRLVKHALLRAAGRPTPADEALTYGPDKLYHLERLEAAAAGSVLTRKPVEACAAEQAANPRSRSAKLRVFEKRR